MMEEESFRIFHIANDDWFSKIQKVSSFETIGKGRQAVVILCDNKKNENIYPIVRTTTVYQKASQLFQPIHRDLASQIQDACSLQLSFNNALVEIYNDDYKNMGFHTDQSLDLGM